MGKLKRVVAGILLLSMGFSFVSVSVKAEEVTTEEEITELSAAEVDQVLENGKEIEADEEIALLSDGLTTCSLAITSSGNYLKVAFQTSASAKASKIGVKSLQIQRYGSSWTKVYPSDGTYSYSKAGTTLCKGGFKLSKKTANKKYRVKATHYATISGQAYSKSKTSSAITH